MVIKAICKANFVAEIMFVGMMLFLEGWIGSQTKFDSAWLGFSGCMTLPLLLGYHILVFVLCFTRTISVCRYLSAC